MNAYFDVPAGVMAGPVNAVTKVVSGINTPPGIVTAAAIAREGRAIRRNTIIFFMAPP
jgi:hypothetical protein